MKKGIQITICLLLVILSGCQTESQNDNSKNNVHTTTKEIMTSSQPASGDIKINPDTEKAGHVQVDLKKLQDANFNVGVSVIAEDKDYIYYSSKDGIYSLNKKNKKDELLLKMEDTWGVSLEGDFLYFIVNYNEKSEICRMDKNGDNFSKVFNNKLITDNGGGGIYGFLIDGNRLIINSELRAYSYDMTSKEVKCVADDTELFRINKGYLYYIDHAEKTFTVYRKKIDGSEPEIVLGKGTSKPENDLYYNFVFYGDDMFYSAYKDTGKYGMYCYSNGISSTINDKYDHRIFEIVEYEGNVYYPVNNNGDDKILQGDNWILMKYDPVTKTESEIGVLKNYQSASSFTIVNGYVYYSSGGSVNTIQVK